MCKRLLPWGLPNGPACCKPSHHEGLQQDRCDYPLHADTGRAVTLSLPSFHLWCLHPGHPEPAAPPAGAQLHLHVPQHRPSHCAGEGKKTQGVSVQLVKKMHEHAICIVMSVLHYGLWIKQGFFFVFSRNTWEWWVWATGCTGVPGSSCSSFSSLSPSSLSPCSSVSRWVLFTFSGFIKLKCCFPSVNLPFQLKIII